MSEGGVLNGLDLFSGIGGLTLALREWVRPVAYCENDRYAQGVLLSRMANGELPIAPIWDDITSLDKACLDEAICVQQEVNSMAGKLKKLSQDQVQQAIEGYQAGMSLGDLAHVFFVTRQAMWDLLRRRIAMRAQLRSGEENHFYRGGNRADARAHDIVDKAIQSGKLHHAGKCEGCGIVASPFKDGRSNIQAHHDDYNKPLAVRWLCQRCHHQWHKNNRATALKGKEGNPEAAIDIIYGGFP